MSMTSNIVIYDEMELIVRFMLSGASEKFRNANFQRNKHYSWDIGRYYNHCRINDKNTIIRKFKFFY